MPTGFAIAAAFLTRLPIGTPADAAGRLAASSWAFPLVGAGVGAIAALVFLVAELLGLGAGAAALLAVLAALCVTGALHEDGLADTADGLFGGNDRPRRLAIMRDSRLGAYGVLALVLSVTLRAAALAQSGEAFYAGLALVAAHAASRGVLPAAMRVLAPARGRRAWRRRRETGNGDRRRRRRDRRGDRVGGARPACGGVALGLAAGAVFAAGLLPIAGSAATPAMFSAPFSRSQRSSYCSRRRRDERDCHSLLVGAPRPGGA